MKYEQGHFAQVFVPVGHQRYEKLVAWSSTAEPHFWKFGKSSDGRDGIWVLWATWSDNQTQFERIGESAVSIIPKHYSART